MGRPRQSDPTYQRWSIVILYISPRRPLSPICLLRPCSSFASHLPYQPTTSYSNCRHSLITLSTTYHHTHTHTHTHSHHVRAIRSPPTARHRPSPIPLRPRLHPSCHRHHGSQRRPAPPSGPRLSLKHLHMFAREVELTND